MAEDDRPATESSASGSVQGGLGVYLRLRELQLSATQKPVDSGGIVVGEVSLLHEKQVDGPAKIIETGSFPQC